MGKKKITGLLGSLMGLSSITQVGALEPNKVEVIAGRDRVETSIKAASKVKSETLVIANAYSFADSLSATNIANAKNAAVLLVSSNTDVYSIMKNKGIKKIYVVGGMVSKNVINNAKKLTNNMTILNGKTRYDTNKMTIDSMGYNKVGVADGRNFPDALSSSPLLKKENLGLMLVDGAKNYKTNKLVKFTFGSKDSVKQDGGKRLGGRDRYKTNEMINDELGSSAKTVSFVNGRNFPDALSAINLVTSENSAIVLMNNSSQKTKDFISRMEKGYIVGGEVKKSDIDRLAEKLQARRSDNTGSNVNPNPSPTPKPNPAPSNNTITLTLRDAVTGKTVGKSEYSDKTGIKGISVPSGYVMLEGQKVDKIYKRMYVAPANAKIVNSYGELLDIATKAVINQFENVDTLVLNFDPNEFRKLDEKLAYGKANLSELNAFTMAMGIKVSASLTNDSAFLDNARYINGVNIEYSLPETSYTGVEFNRDTHLRYMEQARNILKEIGVYENDSLSNEEKAQKISEWIFKNIDYSGYIAKDFNGGEKLEQEKNRSVYSIFKYKEGVCIGYSYGTTILYNMAGIDTGMITTEAHVWNRVKLNGNWVNIDNTEGHGYNKTWHEATTETNTHEDIGMDFSGADKQLNDVFNLLRKNGYKHL